MYQPTINQHPIYVSQTKFIEHVFPKGCCYKAFAIYLLPLPLGQEVGEENIMGECVDKHAVHRSSY